MNEVLLPRTDAGVALQVAVVAVLLGLALWRVRELQLRGLLPLDGTVTALQDGSSLEVLICRAHLVKVRDRAGRLEASGATALFVAHDEPDVVRDQLLAGVGELPFRVLVDRRRDAYDAWGLERAPWWRVWLDPQVWKQYARLLASGERIRGAGRDTLQLGGDFVVAADGTVAYSRPQRRDDRPPVGELLTVVEELAGD